MHLTTKYNIAKELLDKSVVRELLKESQKLQNRLSYLYRARTWGVCRLNNKVLWKEEQRNKYNLIQPNIIVE